MHRKYSIESVAFLFAELQPNFLGGIATVPKDTLLKSISTAVDIAKKLDILVIASGVQMAANEPVEMVQQLKAYPPFIRVTTSMTDDEKIAQELERHGTRIVAIGGISSEIAILHSVLDALAGGFEVHVLNDCCGGFSVRTEHSAFRQMEAAGAIMSNVTSFVTGISPRLDEPNAQAIYSSLSRHWGWGTAGT